MNAFNASAVRGRFRRQVTSVMLVLSLSMGAILATPASAHAASSTYVLAQFQMSGPFATCTGCYSDVGGAWAEWQMWTGSSWHSLGFYQLNVNGTWGWYTTGSYFRIRVSHTGMWSKWLTFGPGYPTYQQARVNWL